MQCSYTIECNVHTKICSCFELLLPCIFWKEIVLDLELGGGGGGRCEDMVNSVLKF